MRIAPAGCRLSELPGNGGVVLLFHYRRLPLKGSPIASICLKDELVFVRLCLSPVQRRAIEHSQGMVP